MRETPSIDPDPISPVPVVVVDDDPATRSRLAMQLGDACDAAPSLEVALNGRPAGAPLVVVLGPSSATAEGLQAAEAALGRRAGAACLLVAAELSTEVLQMALRAGVRDVLAAPVATGQLLAAVQRVASSLEHPQQGPPAPPPDAESAGRARVVTVFSTKGGAGKSVLAANLAVSLARRPGESVCLVDADLQFGDVVVMLKLAPHRTIVDVVASAGRLDPGMLGQLLCTHGPSGLQVLAAPLEPSFADQISPADMAGIIEMLRGMFTWVVIDTPAYFNDVVLALIEESDEVVLVAGMDIPNIKNVKIGLQTLRLLNVPSSKLHLVLNRANSKVRLDVGEVERTLQMKAEALIPSDVVVPQSVNKGIPAVLDAPRSGVARSIEALAASLAGADKPRRWR